MDSDEKSQFNLYLDKIRERAKKSRIHSRHQMIGLMIADALEDPSHKALYIKMARDENGEKMLYMAKSVAENAKITNKGAYFMKVWRLENKLIKISRGTKKKFITKNKKASNKKQNGPHNNKKSKSKNLKTKSAPF